MQSPVLAFIGAGNMAKAIIGGLVSSGYPAHNIIATNPGNEKLQALSNQFGIKTTNDNYQTAKSAEVIILAVKPWIVPLVCKEIEDVIGQQLILSIAAGKAIDSIQQYFQNNSNIIRAMPNTPCLISKGVTGLLAHKDVDQAKRDFVERLFNHIGDTCWITNEQQMDIVTALSGSGPAYYFYLTEALIKAGIELGLDDATCEKLVTGTALGSASMLTHQPVQSAESLRKAVTSPNGTTEAAIQSLDQNQLMKTILHAVEAGTKRGHDLSSNND